jgi:hypothetical protein
VAIEIAYIPHAKVSNFLEGEQRGMQTQLNGTKGKTWLYKKQLKSQQSIITLDILGIV